MNVVERYLDRLVAHDWPAVAACLAPDVERVGPYGDTYAGRDRYVAFLSELMPTLPGYAMRVDRVLELGPVVVGELSETVELDSVPLVTPEVLVFDLDDAGLIAHISVYIQRVGETPPSLG